MQRKADGSWWAQQSIISGDLGGGWGGNASKPLLMKTSACWHSHLSHRRGSRQNWHYGVNKLLRQRRIVRHSTCQWGEQRHLCLWAHNYPTPVGVLVSWWQCTATQMFKTKVKKKVNTIRLALFARWIRLIWALSQFVSSQSLLHNLDTQANTIIHKDWNRVAHKQQGQLKVSIIFFKFQVAVVVLISLNYYDNLESTGNSSCIS